MEITPQELYKKMNEPDFRSHSIVVDVRVPGEHKAERIASTMNIPLDKLADFKDELATYKNVYLHCETGGRSSEACAQLQNMMLDNWVNVQGGIEMWKLQNLPTISQGGVSIQRQVMITAGALVVLFTGLSWVTHALVIGALVIGLGLMVAGISNYCGMARVLRMMPWNR
jgi:Rhodanese-related sulfurtransferase